jgi:signal transduction histidine kinase
MFNLIPPWVTHYNEFHESIRKRNLWFIELRYGAALMLTAMLIGAKYLLGIQLSKEQINVIVVITLLILLYNANFHVICRRTGFIAGKLNGLHFSLLQMLFDLVSLTILVYYMGGIENPMYLFYIFHMIIGSMILPGYIVYILAVSVICVLSLIFYCEYAGIIPHHSIQGLLEKPFYDNFQYISIFLLIFSSMIIISVIIANKIARELYLREKELYESINKLRESEYAKEKYVMGIVHEIKTPIASVQTFLDLILGSYLGPISQEIVNKLNRARNRSDEAIKMINNVLHISKLRLLDDMPLEEVDIPGIIDTIVCNQKLQLEAKSISLKVINNLSSARKIKGDKTLLEIALSNLVSNAVKYVELYGLIEILVMEDESNIIVEISDNGIGIPVGEIDDIFKEFYRASNIKNKNFEGTGLGLSVVNQIIRNHKGAIKVNSPSRLGDERKPGTSFTVSIPFSSIL